MATATWIGVYQKDEIPAVDWESCLSRGVHDELTADIQRGGGTGTTPGILPGPAPWTRMSVEMGETIATYLTQHPLIALIHKSSIDHAKEILCAWCATKAIEYPNAPPEDDMTHAAWVEYYSQKNSERSRTTNVFKLGIPSVHYKMIFNVDEKLKCFYVIGPRDTMLALFGWHAKISDEVVGIDLKFKVELDRNSFLRVHTAVDYAERCHATPLRP